MQYILNIFTDLFPFLLPSYVEALVSHHLQKLVSAVLVFATVMACLVTHDLTTQNAIMEQNIKKAHSNDRMGQLQVIMGKKISQKDREEITGVSRDGKERHREKTRGREKNTRRNIHNHSFSRQTCYRNKLLEKVQPTAN